MGTDVNIMAPTASSGANAKQDAPVRLRLVPPLEEILEAIDEQEQDSG